VQPRVSNNSNSNSNNQISIAPYTRATEALGLHISASVIKQYNLVPANGRWCFAAGGGNREPGGKWQPTAGFMASVTVRADCRGPGSAPHPTLVYMGPTFITPGMSQFKWGYKSKKFLL